ncbi:hypothetical protein NE865_05438 [Phthorimaea operculella]|nr:hypothetical protein NE865_05438 [Phthorimaea operculella]
MDESECHSPRPFVERRELPQAPDIYEYMPVTYSSDPVHRFEYSDSSPYPLAKKTTLPTASVLKPDVYPSNDLNLSMLDVHEPRPLCKSSYKPMDKVFETRERISVQPNVLSPIENTITPPNVLQKDDSFFIRRDNLDKYNFNINPIQRELQGLHIDKENNPLTKKAEIVRMATQNMAGLPEKQSQPLERNTITSDCNCHHCVKPTVPQCTRQPLKPPVENIMPTKSITNMPHPCHPQMTNCFHCQPHVQLLQQNCHCNHTAPTIPQNAVDKKDWVIQRLEQSNKPECMEVEKQTNIAKEKREPTISDLLKIIKLQNEQLQLLQEKVDKFITASTSQQQQIPIQNYMTESVALQTIDTEHKISIGVMTSFEMVRTSTVINKEVLKQNDNAQIQCNRSQISIKEVVSKQPVNLNFLDGISHPTQQNQMKTMESTPCTNGTNSRNAITQATNMNEEKTLNELSLYNVQVDNSTTPQMSPEQTLYLDVRDYSDSDSGSSDDHSNVGWTYYNKVMTHVNGLLQDSDMPSSASALYRNTRQQCVQMQIDKTNVSVTKRVKFGDDPYGIHQPHLYAAATDTSLKMNQLAAKYLNSAPVLQHVVKPISHASNPVEMSLATRNYMEKHKLLQSLPTTSRSPPADEIPRFLDITALKRQTKLL